MYSGATLVWLPDPSGLCFQGEWDEHMEKKREGSGEYPSMLRNDVALFDMLECVSGVKENSHRKILHVPDFAFLQLNCWVWWKAALYGAVSQEPDDNELQKYNLGIQNPCGEKVLRPLCSGRN